jgi:hypothetical protein
VARIPPSLGNGLQCCFPSMHPSQTNEDVGQAMFPVEDYDVDET